MKKDFLSKLKWFGLMAFLAGLLGLTGCSSNKMLVTRTLNEAEVLRNYSREAGPRNNDLEEAERLYAEATKQVAEGEEEKAIATAQLANSHFYYGLARQELSDTERRKNNLEKQIQFETEKLEQAKMALEEARETRGP